MIPLGFEEKYFKGPLTHGITRNLKAVEEYKKESRSFLTGEIRHFASLLNEIYPQVLAFGRELGAVVNHNDFYGNNILFTEGKISALVDFDFCLSCI